jgi:hypothetical protein
LPIFLSFIETGMIRQCRNRTRRKATVDFGRRVPPRASGASLRGRQYRMMEAAEVLGAIRLQRSGETLPSTSGRKTPRGRRRRLDRVNGQRLAVETVR